ncbi:uncharacterized protein isoform X2 [Danio rerio]|uniref:Uncharacterized protein isoform X2 n=1 Tax=Danio rerio TaxID=7955 RepID=A0AC58HTH4_DANRE
MSKARLSRDRRAASVGVSRVTRSSMMSPQDCERSRAPDPGLLDELSLMSVSEQQASATRKGSSKPALSSPSGRSVSRGALETIGRLMKLGRVRNIVVVAGAGISTASGIPDFRTPGTGLYANLAKYDIPYPEAVFNIDYFSDNPHPFFSLAKELYPGHHRPNYVHYFIRMLHQKGLLLRMYTQNIDGLEKLCGIPDDKLVEAHGSFATAACHLCYTPYPAEEAKQAIMNGSVPICTFCAGAVKPNVVFFGEDLPEKYFQHAEDFPKADLLIIMGTSLKHPTHTCKNSTGNMQVSSWKRGGLIQETCGCPYRTCRTLAGSSMYRSPRSPLPQVFQSVLQLHQINSTVTDIRKADLT